MLQPTPQAGAILNYTTLAELEAIGRDSRFVDELISGFVEDTGTLMQRCELALLARHHDEFKDLLHALKGSAMSIGATGLRATCERLEQLPAAGLDRDPAATGAALQVAFAEICDALEDYRRRRAEAALQQS